MSPSSRQTCACTILCPTDVAEEQKTTATYFFKHTVLWKDDGWNPAVDKHVEVVTLDVSDNGPAWSGEPIVQGYLPGRTVEAHADLSPDALASLAGQHSGIAPSISMCHVGECAGRWPCAGASLSRVLAV